MGQGFRGGRSYLQIGDGLLATTPTYVRAGRLMDIEGPDYQADMIEVTDRDDNFKEFIYGQVDAGEVTFTVNFDPGYTQHGTGMGSYRNLQSTATVTAFQIVFVGATNETASFDALVSGVSVAAPMNDAQTADITLKISGEPVYG